MRLLIAEDDPSLSDLLQRHFKYWDWEVDLAATGQGAIDRMQFASYDAILADFVLPDMTGLTVATFASYAQPRVPVVIMSGVDRLGTARLVGQGSNITAVFRKPFRFDDVRLTLEHKAKVRELRTA